ncbi:MAG: CPBP family intramembrane metalloprotease [Acidobacteriia bacterium]|nr:CPBP family intramembrane metalloprotease [Terriglobia bacterium]
MTSRHPFRPVLALALAAAVWLAAMYAVRLVGVPQTNFLPPSFVTHSVMLALSVAAMWLISKGRLDLYGFTKGAYEFSPCILLWVLPTAVLSIVSAVASPGGQGTGGPIKLTKPQMVVFIWVCASIGEETLTRGLLQTLLSRNARVGAEAHRRLSMPVLVSGLFFGSMHIVLVKLMGPAAVPVILLAVFLGLVAARYRERTRSLLPAIIVHALFNIGGMLPLWVIQWLRG